MDLDLSINARQAKYNQRFYGPAPVAKVSVYLKVCVQRVGLDFGKTGLGAAYGARVPRLDHGRSTIIKRHVLSLGPTLFRCEGHVITCRRKVDYGPGL